MKRFYFLGLAICMLTILSCSKETGTINVTYFEASAVYGDMNEVRNMPLNENPLSLVNPGKIYVAEDYILVGEEEKGVHVVDNSDPANPVFTNFINIPGNREFFVKDQYLYAESYYDLLKIDITDVNQVTLASRANYVFAEEVKNDQGETLLGFTFTEISEELDVNSNLYHEIENSGFVYRDYLSNIIPRSAVPSSFAGNSDQQSGTVNRIAHNQDHVYVIGLRKLSIIDDSDAQMNKVGSRGLTDDTETIFSYKNNLFMGSRSSMSIYDASNPTMVSETYRFDHATSCDPVLPTDDVAYISLRTAEFSACPGNINALIVLDIQDLSTPDEVTEIEMQSPYGMTIFNDLLYVGEGENGLKIFDVSDREDPVLISDDKSVEAYDVIKHPSADLILIAGPNGLEQFEMDEDHDLQFKSRISF